MPGSRDVGAAHGVGERDELVHLFIRLERVVAREFGDVLGRPDALLTGQLVQREAAVGRLRRVIRPSLTGGERKGARGRRELGAEDGLGPLLTGLLPGVVNTTPGSKNATACIGSGLVRRAQVATQSAA